MLECWDISAYFPLIPLAKDKNNAWCHSPVGIVLHTQIQPYQSHNKSAL